MSDIKNDLSKSPLFRVLFIDDEANILRTMKRIFHGKPFKIVLADSAQKAFEFMQTNTVHVVVSDMRMPGMSGSEFLAKVAKDFPQTYRIVLSGFADLESTLEVINKGQVHRFLQKPWNNEELIKAVENGIVQYRQVSKNTRLSKLAALQNKQLSTINSALEEQVEQRTKQLKVALNASERSIVTLKKVVYNLLIISPYFSGAFAKSVSKAAVDIAQEMGVEKKVCEAISFAGFICEIGMVGLDAKVITTPFNKLTPAQQDAFFTQSSKAQLILSPATQLQNVTDIIMHQFEYVSGRGFPNNVAGVDIPIGAKILSVARDYIRYRTGKIDGIEHSVVDSLDKLANYSGLQYDGSVINVLKKQQLAASEDSFDIGRRSHQIQPGMVLAESLFNENDILILRQGHVFDEDSIAKIKALEKRFKMTLSILIEE
ncbi:MAG: response regulator RpfG family c-di-GMP phosphodiesterase [Bermanella sp.]|jgi:response regulator RpfG family c-di-GMP phosphodiesterase|uniref:HD domain-containing phosphohydrolase n=1 Tax=Glaciecola sp. 33A TaxID=2057807 RepID=UPI000C32D8CE|nr:HD domain-containing phosphohydrolase [Glaciecola sp. 33A]PKI02722.1 response regulator [Glaciecola sp. 33A]